MRTLVILGGAFFVGIALADLATGKSNTPILPDVIANQMSQELDVASLILGSGLIWYGLEQM